MVTETEFLDQTFRPETQELSGQQTDLNWGFLTGNPEIAGEIQILRQVFRTEIQILIVISSPEFCDDSNKVIVLVSGIRPPLKFACK